jgi:heme-degrading monooxygenase HmoA
MVARVSTYSGDGDALVEGFSGQTEALEQVDGFEKAYFLVDREKGRAVSITFWSSESALQESAARADQMREEATGPSGASIDSVDSYEVAITVGSA